MKFAKKLKIKNFIILFFAGIINAVGVTVFLQPVRLYDSGISGTSMFLSQITPHWLSLSVFLIVLNIPIFIFGAKRQGIEFTIYSVFVVAVYSLSAWFCRLMLQAFHRLLKMICFFVQFSADLFRE